MVMSFAQDGRHKEGNKSFSIVEKFKYLGETLSTQYCLRE
jgi:hypothetical protein